MSKPKLCCPMAKLEEWCTHNCAWWCEDAQKCAMLVIAEEKKNDKGERKNG